MRILIISLSFLQILSLQAQRVADIVINNGKVFTMDASFAIAEAVAISGNKIIATGTNEVIEKYQNAETKLIDAQGKMVLPGLIEGHGHFLGLGNNLKSLDLMQTKSWSEILDIIKEWTAATPKGEWITGRGWHQEKWTSTPEPNINGYPLHNELSVLTPDHPVLLRHASGHALIANAKAMEICGISSMTQQPDGGEIVKTKNSELSGVFIENAMKKVTSVYQVYLDTRTEQEKEHDLIEMVNLAAKECHRYGITTFCDAGTSIQKIIELENLASEGKLPVRLWVMCYDSPEAIDNFMHNRKELSPKFFTVGGIKGFMDGALGSYGAWLLEPYHDKPDDYGKNVMTSDEISTLASIAKKHNLQMCTHAIGDRANKEVLNIYQKILSGDIKKRWRIEHAQHLSPQDIPRFKELGIIAAMQPVHCTSDAPFVPKRLGDERAKTGAYLWRELLEQGVILGSGTDVPVEPLNPYSNLFAAVTRKATIEGESFYPIQSMTRQEALMSLTIGNAYAAFQEKEKGSIEVGKLADIIIMNKDLMNCTEAEILEAKVLVTILDGKIVYEAK